MNMQLDLFLDTSEKEWELFIKQIASKETIKEHGGIKKVIQIGQEMRAKMLKISLQQYKELLCQKS